MHNSMWVFTTVNLRQRGMIYTDINDDKKVSLVSDIHALPLPNQTQLMQDMEQYLLNVAQQISTTVILQK